MVEPFVQINVTRVTQAGPTGSGETVSIVAQAPLSDFPKGERKEALAALVNDCGEAARARLFYNNQLIQAERSRLHEEEEGARQP